MAVLPFELIVDPLLVLTMMKPKEIHSFADLQDYLRNFTTWDGDNVHDFGGATILLGALLDNLRTNVSDIALIADYLDPEQKAFLEQLAQLPSRLEED